jgi:hypothetical protein
MGRADGGGELHPGEYADPRRPQGGALKNVGHRVGRSTIARIFTAQGIPSAERLFMRFSGGRSWWAHFEFTTINIELTILRKKIEEPIKVQGFGWADRAVSDGLTMRSLRATDLSPDRAEGSFDQLRSTADRVSPAPATSPTPQPRAASHETSIELGCGCGRGLVFLVHRRDAWLTSK